jgi:putative IMPACT (imprinted ancient) family translation regulator
MSPRTFATAVSAGGERIIVKGSHFVAHAVPLGTETSPELAKREVARLKALTPEAAHHGYAFRIGPDDPDFGWSDGGEPLGSAGRPILARLESASLLNALVVISRVPHGGRLAATDLAHGYGEAARAILAAAGVAPFQPTRSLTLTFDYALSGPVQGVLGAHGATHIAADYGERVTLTVSVPSDTLVRFERALGESTAGRVEVSRPVVSKT